MKLTFCRLNNQANLSLSNLINFKDFLQFQYFILRVFFISFIFCGTSTFLFSQPQWKRFGNLQIARHLHSALPIDANNILVMGGFINSYGSHSGQPTATCEKIDLSNNLISQAVPMVEPRAEFVALTMPDSNIIVISGVTTNGALTSNCEIYNRTLKSWRKFGSLLVPRRQHSAQFINSTEILIVGGRHQDLISMNDAEIFNIVTGKTRKIVPYPVVFNVGFGSISSAGEFVLCGGRSGGPNSERSKDVFKYNVANDQWIKTSELSNGVGAGQGIRLWNGHAFFSGGSLTEEPPTSAAEIYFESNSSYSLLSQMRHNRTWHSLAQWNDDTVVIFGGFTVGGAEGNGTMLRSTDWLSLNKKISFKGPELVSGHAYFTAVSLPLRDASGKVLKSRILAISGLGANNQNTSTVEILEASLPPVITAFQSTCTSVDVTISHSTQLDSAWLLENQSENVTLGFVFTPAFPSQSVGAWIRLKNPLKAGKYTLRAIYKTNSGDLTTDFSGEISPSSIPVSISTGGAPILCEGKTQTLDAGSGFTSYLWSNGQTTRTIEVSSKGKYSVIVMNKDSCFGNDSVEISVRIPRKPFITTGTEAPCEGDSLTLNAGGGFTAYLWSTKEVSQSITVKKSGTYSVITVDEFGCESQSDIIIAFKTTLGLEITSGLDSEKRIAIDAVFPPDMRCRDITFKNTRNSIFTLDKIDIAQNIEFSVPQAQFPLIIQPGEERTLTVCFSPAHSGTFQDTLIIGAGDCNPVEIALYSEGHSDVLSGTSRCNIPITTGIRQGYLSVSEPYPNPAQHVITINAEFTGNPSLSCVLKDIFGTIVQTGSFLKTDDRSGAFTVSSANLPAGLYALCISSEAGFKIFPVIVE